MYTRYKKKALLLFLAWICLSACVPGKALAATIDQLNQSGMFLKQQTSYTCTLVSAVMMVRRAALADGDSDWKDITEDSMRGTAWVEGGGLSHEFSYAGISVDYGELPGGSSNAGRLIQMLKNHPEGIVIYDRDKPHAILITDYTGGTFYCADPAGSTPDGRISVSDARISVSGAESYWYVAYPRVTVTAPDLTPRRTIADGEYHIVTRLNPAYGLSVSGNATKSGRNIQLSDQVGKTDTSTLVQVTCLSGGYYKLTMKNSGKVLHAQNAGRISGTNVQQYTDTGHDSQRWIIREAGNGWYYIISKLSGLYLDVSGDNAANGQNVWLYSEVRNNAQKWRFIERDPEKESIRSSMEPAAPFSQLQLRASRVTKNSITLQWKKAAGASGYIIYGSQCGKKYQKMKTISSGSITTWTKKDLEPGKYYKFYVAVIPGGKNNSKISASSPAVYIATSGGKAGNEKSVSLLNIKNQKITLKAGKRFYIESRSLPAGTRQAVKRYRELQFESTSPAVAFVGKTSGILTAKKAGRCTIYVYAQNGVFTTIRVTVKE